MVTTLDDLPLRDDLRGKHPYGAPQAVVPVALNVNENTHPVPDEVIADIIGRVSVALQTVNRYPDREFRELRDALAGYLGHGLTSDGVWAANGSNEVLQHVLQAFGGPGRSLLGFAPTYSMYSILASGSGTAWIPVDRQAAFEVGAEYAAEHVHRARPDIVFLCAPNNPTGTPLDLAVIESVYDATEGIVVVDEAYAEFAGRDAPTALSLLPGRPRLLVSRTMSKAFAFAGVRLGYLAADPAVVDALRLVRLPYHLSALTQAAATAALAHADEMLAMVGEIIVQRDRMIDGLRALGYHPYATGSNFVLFGGVDDPVAVFEGLLARGVLIRDVGIPGHLRVSAGTEEETTAFLAALASLPAPSADPAVALSRE
ncbi:histidinol-phosphate transaminase [Rathayibacter iranicus]|uniref:Histidinol-phosphate aminotransferase n=1 Tax=Rathayibacter iranicus TaxID=59737 RepID=A0AAD2JFY6_9MICO|nr:histidinol-phosphate transaminase [Rathayibacter iranicus]AZZ54754.1 histidinol-phosphate transaminase [Rathayibacter iranicus]MWV30547.1 histidinol-phosphate transaminase [Rathayibacter iranicus NCPPB 2253 = VKM Ac-1602]PPI51011.1 histidinol-phosphate transaminase [Rathayibacter iranicus]PPI62951.1 histidinol-phosphate transaminase [Rathayibacter iranicus]PPI73911.1 histidinol-phosphate transaminase [Rathayibacter iranicus]